MYFTAKSEGSNGLLLVMSGRVQPVFAKRTVRLTANLTVTLPPFGVIVEELAKGYEVEACPYDLTQPDSYSGRALSKAAIARILSACPLLGESGPFGPETVQVG